IPGVVGDTAVTQPGGFLFGHKVLEVYTPFVDGVQLVLGVHAVDGVGGGIFHKGHPVVIQVGQALHGAGFHLKGGGIIVGQDQLRAVLFVLALHFAGALAELLLGFFVGDALPQAVFVLLGEVGADGAVLQLHNVFGIIPLVVELQQVDGALAGRGDAQVAGIDAAAVTDGDIVAAVGA